MKTKQLLAFGVTAFALALTSCGGPASSIPEKSDSSADSSTASSKNDSSASSSSSADPVIHEGDSLAYAADGLYTNREVYDSGNGFNTLADFTSLKAFVSGKYVPTFTSSTSRQDIKLELYGANAMRFVNVSGGYVFSLPYTQVDFDYSINRYRTQATFGDSVLSVSFESSNPYTSNTNPWYIYGSEWLMGHLMNEDFISKNGLERTLPMDYTFTAANPYGDLTFKEGYDVYFFGIKIAGDTKNQVERPYYSIGVVRAKNDPKNFALFVLKSKTNQDTLMKNVIKSYSRISSKGTAKNYFYSKAPVENPQWNAETKTVYENILSKEYVNWGAFSYSMPADSASLTPGHGSYDTFFKNSQTIEASMESKWGHPYEIYPTYSHLGSKANTFVQHHFPLQMAQALAGGNITDGKPILQFTFQYTTNNNIVADQVTPIYDILRGKYDDEFREIATDMKTYAKPIMIRLNNEMNTDWTSYSGIMSLLDPDIFVMTWRRFYDICQQVGCDNLMWIWNPIAVSCPYSSWGEDLCYFPGVDYVQFLGGTNYEMNNYDAATAAVEIESFDKRYSSLYKKNSASFSTEWKMIIGEFACGSGGSTSGKLGRNAAVQAQWVKDMFTALNSTTPSDYVKQLRGAIWFNCNDEVGSEISNRLQIIARPTDASDAYDDLAATWAAFKQGFRNGTAN